jgi:hypothetical protein
LQHDTGFDTAISTLPYQLAQYSPDLNRVVSEFMWCRGKHREVLFPPHALSIHGVELTVWILRVGSRVGPQ